MNVTDRRSSVFIYPHVCTTFACTEAPRSSFHQTQWVPAHLQRAFWQSLLLLGKRGPLFDLVSYKDDRGLDGHTDSRGFLPGLRDRWVRQMDIEMDLNIALC